MSDPGNYNQHENQYQHQPARQEQNQSQPQIQAQHPPARPSYESPNGTAILIIGIVGFFMFPAGIIAWVWGNSERKYYPEDRNVSNGRMLGMVATLIMGGLMALIILFYIFIFAVLMLTVGGAALTQ